MNSRIDLAADIGMDVYSTEMTHNDIRNANTINIVKAGISRAHSKNPPMKFVIKFSCFKWTTANTMEELMRNSSATQSFYDDFDYVLQNLEVDGLYLEEPQFGHTSADGGLAYRTWNNTFFTNLKNKITARRDYGNFIWAFNTGSNYRGNLLQEGIDLDTINQQKTFNCFFPQDNGVFDFDPNECFVSSGATKGQPCTEGTSSCLCKPLYSLDTYRGVYDTWQKSYLPDLYVVPVAFLTWQGLADWCKLKNASPSAWGVSNCWNQEFASEVRWTNDNNIPVNIFTLYYVDKKAAVWTDSNPGTTTIEKLENIWSGSSSPSVGGLQ